MWGGPSAAALPSGALTGRFVSREAGGFGGGGEGFVEGEEVFDALGHPVRLRI